MPIFKKGAAFNGNKATGLADGTASTDAATKGQMDVNDQQVGQFVRTGGFVGVAGSSTVAISAGNAYWRPMRIGKGGTVTSVKVNVTTAGAGGTLIYLGLYAHNASAGLPTGSPIGGGFGSVAGDSTGLKSITISQALTDNTVYWICVVPTVGSPTVSCIRDQISDPLLSAWSGANGYAGGMLDWNSGSFTGLPATPDARPTAGNNNTYPSVIFGA